MTQKKNLIKFSKQTKKFFVLIQVFKLGHSQKCPQIKSCSSSPSKQSVILLHKSSIVKHFELPEQRNDDLLLQDNN